MPPAGSEVQPLVRSLLGGLAFRVRLPAKHRSPAQWNTMLVDGSFDLGRVFKIRTGLVELILRKSSHLKWLS